MRIQFVDSRQAQLGQLFRRHRAFVERLRRFGKRPIQGVGRRLRARNTASRGRACQ